MSTSDRIDEKDAGQQLANRLREAREFLNLSQKFVSEQTGIPRSAVSDIERGTRRVESTELKRLAELYRMPVDFLLGIKSEGGVSDENDPVLRALAREAGRMTDQEKEQVLRFALFLRNFERPTGDER